MYRNTTQNCTCSENYFDQGFDLLNNSTWDCLGCPQYCETCSNLTSCLSCVANDPNRNLSNACLCNDGYYQLGTNLLCQSKHYASSIPLVVASPGDRSLWILCD